MNVYHKLPEDVEKLTDLQISKLCYHPREDDGSIVPVEEWQNREPQTLVDALIRWDHLALQLMMRKEDVEAGRQKLRDKWANKQSPEDNG